MEILNARDEKVQIEYPANWEYKVIAFSKNLITNAIKDIIDDRDHTLTHSHNSKNGKYISMNLDILVHNEDDRNIIFESLKKHKDIKMVL